ncbi:hypothetical protein SAMN04489844_4072 [Nocardioides exalbidus]|uniref:Uncharacterized protein n=1 Tax=Nocardioides exalbidus TaxID=402596 RepID=A0A1H4ZCH1_9ACTN|nr:hypothetical protein [Nocardioides exalbidus]SED27555.1 hypothetical protein SAMN04489844_4072 [Nocardioides exalbidus]
MTTQQEWVQVGLVAAGLVALAALVLALLARRRARHAESSLAELADRIAVLESPAAVPPTPAPDAAATTYVITGIGVDDDTDRVPDPVARPIDGRLFADIVARETVVKAASWTHGVRRALSPESRNRIRFQVRQESRQAGRERRAEMKQALREFRARERDAGRTVTTKPAEDVA